MNICPTWLEGNCFWHNDEKELWNFFFSIWTKDRARTMQKWNHFASRSSNCLAVDNVKFEKATQTSRIKSITIRHAILNCSSVLIIEHSYGFMSHTQAHWFAFFWFTLLLQQTKHKNVKKNYKTAWLIAVSVVVQKKLTKTEWDERIKKDSHMYVIWSLCDRYGFELCAVEVRPDVTVKIYYVHIFPFIL